MPRMLCNGERILPHFQRGATIMGFAVDLIWNLILFRHSARLPIIGKSTIFLQTPWNFALVIISCCLKKSCGFSVSNDFAEWCPILEWSTCSVIGWCPISRTLLLIWSYSNGVCRVLWSVWVDSTLQTVYFS